MSSRYPTRVQMAILVLTFVATCAFVLWRRANPVDGLWRTAESLGAALVWVTVLVGSGLWKGRKPVEEPVTLYNSAWTPEFSVGAGYFLGWLASERLLSRGWSDNPDVASFARRDMTGPELLENWGEKIVSEMLNETGFNFTLDYFAASDDYFDDYHEVLGILGTTEDRDDWKTFDALKVRIDERFAAWKTGFPLVVDSETGQ